MKGSETIFSTFFLSLLLHVVSSKVIECDKSALLNAKITELTEDKVNSESTTFKEFLEKFKQKSSTNFTVQIRNEIIPQLCENSFEHISGISVLNLTSNNINTLKAECFSGITALEILDLADNELQEIKNGVFNDFKHLKELVLSYNAISEIGSRAFGNLPALRRIRLDHNNIVILGRDWFQHSPNLRHLDLSHNCITAVGPGVFQTIRPTCDTGYKPDIPNEEYCPPNQGIDMIASALTINLRNNDIISFHPDALDGLVYVGLLDLRYNKLISFRWSDIKPMFGEIDLRDNLPNLKEQNFPADGIIIERDKMKHAF